VLFSIKVKELLYSKRSAFQQIDILESEEFGRILTLDGLMMVTEKDEFIYHDLIVHPAMCVNPMIKKVLVIGGGDGGTVRELVRYQTIEQIDMVEIDEQVVHVCAHFLPITSMKLKDPRVNLHFEDGINWVKNTGNSEYDLIIVDSTDPVGPGKTLFSTEFYQNCFRILSENGILINQQISLCFAWDTARAKQAHTVIKRIFPIARLYQAHTPTYASGLSLFGFASKTLDPIQDAKFEVWNQLGLQTRYYNTDLHVGAFIHPTYISKLLDMPLAEQFKDKKNRLIGRLHAFFSFMASHKNTSGCGLDLWLAENWSKNARLSIRVTNHLYSKTSAFQQIDVFESEEFGRLLALDGSMVFNERDEFIHHDLMVHPALCANPMIKTVLVIGNGGGGVVRELTRYETIAQIDLVELDEQVVHACEQFLPRIAPVKTDARVRFYFEDGATWVATAKDEAYDLIIIASGNRQSPVEFYQNCSRILSKDGIFINQHENPYFAQAAYEMKQVHGEIKKTFPISKVYQAHIPSHPSGYRLFGFSSKTLDPIRDAKFEVWNHLGLETKCYNTDLHVATFQLPTYVKEMLEYPSEEPRFY